MQMHCPNPPRHTHVGPSLHCFMQMHCPNPHRQTGRQTDTCRPIPALLHADALSHESCRCIVPTPTDTCSPSMHRLVQMHCPNPHRHMYPCTESCRYIVPTPTDTQADRQTHVGLSLHCFMQRHCPNHHRHMYLCTESCRCIVPTPTDTCIPALNHEDALCQPRTQRGCTIQLTFA